MPAPPRNETHGRPAAAPVPGSKDFAALRASGEPEGPGRAVGGAVGRARDAVARALIRIGATPNRITVLGLVFTCGGGYCLARGANNQVPYLVTGPGPVSWWPLAAAGLLILAAACDMLDGAVARLARAGTQVGGVLDSVIDRFSDIAIFAGCLLYFATQPTPSLTYQVLALAALCNALLISYVKARAENLIDDCSVGFWLRGERTVAVLIGCLTGHVPAVLWQLATSGFFTVYRRIDHALRSLHALDTGRPAPARGPSGRWWGRLQLWRHPRGSVPHDVVCALHIGYIIFAPLIWPALQGTGPHADPLRAWLGG